MVRRCAGELGSLRELLVNEALESLRAREYTHSLSTYESVLLRPAAPTQPQWQNYVCERSWNLCKRLQGWGLEHLGCVPKIMARHPLPKGGQDREDSRKEPASTSNIDSLSSTAVIRNDAKPQAQAQA